MATVSEKMTQLANAIRSKTGGTAKLSLDGMITAVNGISTGGSSTSSYTMWGSHSLKTYDINVSSFQGVYDVSQMNTGTYFFANGVWNYDGIDNITVTDSGSIEIYSLNYDVCNTYSPLDGCWYDEDEMYRNDSHMLVIEFISQVTVSQNLYNLFSEIFDNGDYDMTAFDRGHEVGYELGAASASEFLADGLCDWEMVVDEQSMPYISFYNYHPTLSMTVDILLDSEYVASVTVDPNGSESWHPMEEGYPWAFAQGAELGIYNVRWD